MEKTPLQRALVDVARVACRGSDDPPRRGTRISSENLAGIVHWQVTWRLPPHVAESPRAVRDVARRCALKLCAMSPSSPASVITTLLRRISLPLADDDLADVVSRAWERRARGLALWESRRPPSESESEPEIAPAPAPTSEEA